MVLWRRTILAVAISVNCYGVTGQFYSGPGDGFESSRILGTRLNGEIISSSALYQGGAGDGSESIQRVVALGSNMDYMYVGSSGDGYSEARIFAVLTENNIAEIFSGGVGDGFANLYLTTGLNSWEPSALYSGGTADGEVSGPYNAAVLSGDILGYLGGGTRDGGDYNTLSNSFLSGQLPELYNGGGNDGNVHVSLHSTALTGSPLPIYGGGNGDGALNSSVIGFFGDALPVEWISFEAKVHGQGVLLNWSTATELNNDQFEIQRSGENQVFQTIHTKPGAGTTNEPNHYKYFDDRPQLGGNFYRLKQVDFDGQFSYSDIKYVILESVQDYPQSVSIFPNPVEDRTLNISAEGFDNSLFEIEIWTLDGKLLLSKMISSNHNLKIPWEWAPGIYKVIFQDSETIITKNLLIKD